MNIPCPHCKTEIDAKATVCPHCHQPVMHKDPGKNAILTLISYVVTFWLLYQGLTWFIDRETEKTMTKINKEAEETVRRMNNQMHLYR